MDGDYAVPDFISKEAQDIIVKILNTDPEKRLGIDEIKDHAWFRTSLPVYLSDGLIIGYNRIPIQNKILNLMNKQGFDPKYIQRCIDANKHNHCTTTYYIYLKKLKLEDKLEVIKSKGKFLSSKIGKESSKERQEKLEKDPASNLIDDYLKDDVSDDSYCRMDSSKVEEGKEPLEDSKVDMIYKAFNQNLERSRLANNRQYQTHDKNYDNSKITLNLENSYSKRNETSQSRISNFEFNLNVDYSNFKSEENSFVKSRVQTLENTLSQANKAADVYQDDIKYHLQD